MKYPVTRRELLRILGAAGVTAYSGAALAAPTGLQRLNPLSGGFPRAFFFRQAEVLANLRAYGSWRSALKGLGGITGKLLAEERTDTVSARNTQYFAQFKAQFPTQIALLHLNGVGRLPRFETEGWFPGFWLYAQGTRLSTAISASSGQFVVDDLTPFEFTTDAFGGRWIDIVVTSRDANGRPDFAAAEYCRVTATDPATRTLTVVRGAYGLPARAFGDGAYVAPMITYGPFTPVDDKVWVYNFASNAPRDASGRSVSDAIVEGLIPKLGAGGMLAMIDGIQLDTFYVLPRYRAVADADGDGIADGAMAAGIDTFEIGQSEFTQRLAEALGPDRLLLADARDRQRPDPDFVNGIETEGFPSLFDYEILLWSQSLARFNYWQLRGREARFSYPLFKFSTENASPASYPRFRLALAASLFAGTAFSFYDEPVPGSLIGLRTDSNAGQFPNQLTVWDELVGGDLQTPKWLGAPLGPTRHIALSRADLYDAGGANLTPAFMAGCTSRSCKIRRLNGGTPSLSISGSKEGLAALTMSLPSLQTSTGELVLVLEASATARAAYPAGMPRYLRVAAGPGNRPLELAVPVDAQFSTLVLSFRRLPVGSVPITISIDGTEPMRLRSIRAYAGGGAAVREFEFGAVLANASDLSESFDLATLFPGRTFRRLLGSAGQDPQTNNGSPVSGVVTLGPLDALLLRH